MPAPMFESTILEKRRGRRVFELPVLRRCKATMLLRPDISRVVAWLDSPWPGKPIPPRPILCHIRTAMPEAEPEAEPGPHTHPVFVTVFRDRAGTQKGEGSLALEELRDLVRGTNAPAKDALPLLKFARYGDVPNPKTGSGSLRWNGNVVGITGVVVDYDGEEMGVAAAVDRFGKAGLVALVYASPSYTDAAPRWRACCPCSRELPPDQHYRLVARVNGVLGGVLADESFCLSQAYYYGFVEGNPAPRAEIVAGTRYLDQADELDATAIGKRNGNGARHAAGNGQGYTDFAPGEPEAPIEDIVAALEMIPNDDLDWNEWVRIGLAVYRASGGSEAGYAAWED